MTDQTEQEDAVGAEIFTGKFHRLLRVLFVVNPLQELQMVVDVARLI